jgi:hypothetical protein
MNKPRYKNLGVFINTKLLMAVTFEIPKNGGFINVEISKNPIYAVGTQNYFFLNNYKTNHEQFNI